MRYDPILCMMVDDSVKTKDGVGDIISYKGYKLEMVTPKDVVIYKNGKRIDLSFKYPKTFKEAKERIDKGEFDSDVKTADESEKYAVIMKNSSGKEQYTQGWDLGSIRNWIKENERRGYRVTWKNFDNKTVDEAIRLCDSREEDIADELFDALQQIGKRNINKAEAEFLAEEFFDDKVSANELMRIFNKYKKEYL